MNGSIFNGRRSVELDGLDRLGRDMWQWGLDGLDWLGWLDWLDWLDKTGGTKKTHHARGGCATDL